jgi:hypothetical protein
MSDMLQAHQIDDLITLVSTLDRQTLLNQFRSYRASFPIDFTDAFLCEMPLERMRHIFVAMCLQSQRLPDDPTPVAA